MKSSERTRITLRFPKWLDKEIEKQSDYLGMTKNSFLIMALNDILRNTKNTHRSDFRKGTNTNGTTTVDHQERKK